MTTKEKIKEKAFDLLSSSGYVGASMRNIAGEVGIRESAIYNHYLSKDDLVKIIFNEIGKELDLVDLIDDVLLDELNNPKKFLMLFSEKLLTHWADEKQQKIFRIILLEQFSTHGLNIKLEEVILKMKEVWNIIFSEMMKYKFIKKQDVEIVTNEFIAPLFFVRLKYLSSPNDFNLPLSIQETSQHIDYFWNSIKK